MSDISDGAKLHSGVIFGMNINASIPIGYLQLAVEKNPSCAGVACIVPENKEVTISRLYEKATAAQLDAGFKALPGHGYVTWVGNSKKGTFHNDDVQPFVMLTDGKTSDGEPKPTAAVFLDGDFSPFREEKSEHSDEYHYATKFLQKKLKAISKLANGDLDKIAEALADDEDSLFGRDLTGTIVFAFGNGKILRFRKPLDAAKDTSFGFTTDMYGYKDDSPATTVQPGQKGGFFGKAVEATKAVIHNATAPADKTDTATKPPVATGQKGQPYVMMKCPKDIQKKGDIKAWYESHTLTSQAPPKWHQKPLAECNVPEGFKGEILYKPFKDFASAAKALATATPEGATSAPEKELAAAEAAEANEEVGEEDYIFPTVEKEEREAVLEKVVKFQDEHKDFVQDPRAMAEWEQTREVFGEVVGLGDGVESTPVDLTPEFIEDMWQNHPVSHLTWSFDMWQRAVTAEAKLAELEATVANPSTTKAIAPRTVTRRGNAA